MHQKIISFQFRTHKFGDKHVGRVGLNRDGKEKWKDLFYEESSYFHLFIDGYTYMESCYQCPFACEKRVSDFTISDYWGWEKESYLELTQKGVREGDGVSAILIHTEKGKKFFDAIKDKMISVQVEPEGIVRHNPQLSRPSQGNLAGREKMIEGYIRNGYDAIEQFHKAQYGLKRYSLRLRCMIPIKIRNRIKKYILHM